uniref:FZ domain-containing protein n=1 Tax=Chelydra serpentina TaxID=8475 RepID=A0A8C3S691_CHESE
MFPAAQMLFALSGFLTSTMGFDIGLSTKCVAIPMEMGMCHGVGYSEMRLPNLMGHTSMAEVIPKSAEWQHFVQTACHPHARTFLCSLFAPVCLDTFIHPCRSMCVAVRDSCAPVLLCHGLSWPDSLDCDRFPADEDMCLASLSKEYKHIHKGRWRGWVGVSVSSFKIKSTESIKYNLRDKFRKQTVSGDQEYNIECQVEFINQGLLMPYDTRNTIQQWLLMNENCTQRMTQTYRPMVYLIVGNIEEGTVLVNQIYRWQRRDSQLTLATRKWKHHKCL